MYATKLQGSCPRPVIVGLLGPGARGANRLRELAAGHPASEVPDKTGVFHIALIASIAAYFLIFPVYRGVFFLEIAPNESWNAYHQDAALGAGPLYPAADTLVINNYPPLSFYLIEPASRHGIDAHFQNAAVGPRSLDSPLTVRALNTQFGFKTTPNSPCSMR